MTAEPHADQGGRADQGGQAEPADRVEQPEPVLRITAGRPTDEELAAVTVLLLAISRSRSAAPAPVQPVGGWADPAYRLRRPLPPGPGAWRASAWT